MQRDSRGRGGPRRPRQGRERERERDPAEVRERIDREFQREIEMRIAYFLRSPEQELELEPMNSYRRRMVHNISGKYNLRSESRGEDRDRYVCLVKTEETPAGDAAAGEAAAAAAPVTAAPAPRVRLWDYGTQTFPVNPGANGIHMALKVDGSLELFRERDRAHILADRVITSREFRVRQGKLLMPDDPGY